MISNVDKLLTKSVCRENRPTAPRSAQVLHRLKECILCTKKPRVLWYSKGAHRIHRLLFCYLNNFKINKENKLEDKIIERMKGERVHLVQTPLMPSILFIAPPKKKSMGIDNGR